MRHHSLRGRTKGGAAGSRSTPHAWPCDGPVAPQPSARAIFRRREVCVARQQEINASIATTAVCQDRGIARVAGPFTVESLAPHRTLGVHENDEVIEHLAETKTGYDGQQDFATIILEHLNTSSVQQAHREDRISFTALTRWPGDLICAEGRYVEGLADTGTERRAGIFIGPEFGTVSRPDLVAAAREAADADFDVNADLHVAGDLKNTGNGNLFVIFGEPDIEIIPVQDNGTGARQIQVKVNGVNVFHPNTGEIRSDRPDGIACWFVDTDYNEESFFVRHAYFLGANDPYKARKITLKTEIHRDAWDTLHSDTSRRFDRTASGRIAVKVINHLGDEVMRVFRV